MSAEAVEPTPARSFKEASPREIRAALTPEEQVQFDITWHTALTTALETLDLSKVHEMLESWRVHAVLTDQLGHHGYREWLARAETHRAHGRVTSRHRALESTQGGTRPLNATHFGPGGAAQVIYLILDD